MGGKPLATSAVAAAAVAWRAPEDYSVLAFGKDIVVAKSQDVHKDSERVVNDVLTSGCHYLAVKTVLLERFPRARIRGLFIARRAFPDAADDFAAL